MLTFENGGILIESAEELPELSGDELFLDTETSSFNAKIRSVNPWHDCYVLGLCIAVDDSPAYYIPINHEHGGNLDAKTVQLWLARLFTRIKRWINHNVKYDCQVLFKAFGLRPNVEMHCTLDLAKLIDSDRMNHSLDSLSKDWLKEDISKYEKAFEAYLGKKNKDYRKIPRDILGEYGCQDILTNRRLWKFILKMMPTESQGVSATSSKVTGCLARIEQTGMKIDPKKVALKELLALNRMVGIQSEIAEIIGYTIEPHVNADCYDVLCNNLGFPVLEYNESGNPSFDKHALKRYQALPGAPRQLIDLMLEYRKLQTFTSLFTKTFRKLHINGILHSTYKQTVRTGRMACSTPNQQQADDSAKELIEPREGNVIINADYSQIEFRVIVHYIQDAEAIAAYTKDPFTDFHEWVAKVCAIHRKPAKTVNFLMGYGGGQARLVGQLMQVVELVGDILEQIEKLDIPDAEKKARFASLARARGTQVYNTYHDTLPGLKRTSRAATNRVHQRGYCVNKYGRRRQLPDQFAWRAFNTVCQGTAADMMKERLVALEEWLDRYFPNFKLIGVVHDSVVIEGPKAELSEYLLDGICYVLEDIQIKLRVPIRTSIGWSDKNWKDASSNDSVRKFDRATFNPHLNPFAGVTLVQ